MTDHAEMWVRLKIPKKHSRGESVERLAVRYGLTRDKVRRILAVANNR